jgi:hypothetical protein
LIAGIRGSNPAETLDVRILFAVCCVGSGLSVYMNTRSEESYRVRVRVRVRVFTLSRDSITRRPRPDFGCCVTEKNGFSNILWPVEVGGGRGILKSSGETR